MIHFRYRMIEFRKQPQSLEIVYPKQRNRCGTSERE